MTDLAAPPVAASRRWLFVAAVGCGLIALTLITVALVIWDKAHFGWMAGSAFLGWTTAGVFVGALLVLVATWNLPIRRTWRGAVLFAWALIALTSPLFGYLFLLPWAVLVLMMPFVVAILYRLFARARSAS